MARDEHLEMLENDVRYAGSSYAYGRAIEQLQAYNKAKEHMDNARRQMEGGYFTSRGPSGMLGGIPSRSLVSTSGGTGFKPMEWVEIPPEPPKEVGKYPKEFVLHLQSKGKFCESCKVYHGYGTHVDPVKFTIKDPKDWERLNKAIKEWAEEDDIFVTRMELLNEEK